LFIDHTQGWEHPPLSVAHLYGDGSFCFLHGVSEELKIVYKEKITPYQNKIRKKLGLPLIAENKS
jgi:hypothetical protein